MDPGACVAPASPEVEGFVAVWEGSEESVAIGGRVSFGCAYPNPGMFMEDITRTKLR